MMTVYLISLILSAIGITYIGVVLAQQEKMVTPRMVFCYLVGLLIAGIPILNTAISITMLLFGFEEWVWRPSKKVLIAFWKKPFWDRSFITIKKIPPPTVDPTSLEEQK